MGKSGQRGERTRKALQAALIELIAERSYDAITIQDIVGRAKVGRTTFYLHYGSKDALFIGCHESIASQFHFGPLHPLSQEELLSAEAPPAMVAAYQHLEHVRMLLHPIFQGKDSLLILRQIRDWRAHELEANLQAAFAGATSAIAVEVLANYLAGAQIALIQWWLEKRQPCTCEDLARTFHRLQRAAIRDAFGLR